MIGRGDCSSSAGSGGEMGNEEDKEGWIEEVESDGWVPHADGEDKNRDDVMVLILCVFGWHDYK